MYAILKNGLVLHHFEAGNEFRTVEIRCDKFYARTILAAAEMYCPEAVAGTRWNFSTCSASQTGST